ncbi:hypothetical protein L211DRAFT_204306, partial [Terfezia boudieri ATCC MYA-4762]
LPLPCPAYLLVALPPSLHHPLNNSYYSLRKKKKKRPPHIYSELPILPLIHLHNNHILLYTTYITQCKVDSIYQQSTLYLSQHLSNQIPQQWCSLSKRLYHRIRAFATSPVVTNPYTLPLQLVSLNSFIAIRNCLIMFPTELLFPFMIKIYFSSEIRSTIINSTSSTVSLSVETISFLGS